MNFIFASALAFSLLLTLAQADFPAIYNSDPGNAQPPTPQESLKMLKLPPGFKATLFAAEPDVQNPIAMAWDQKGRMWVAENYTYAEREKRFDLGLKDRVVILEDKDWDGVAETRKVFTEDVQMLTSVEVGRGGVWLMCPPQVLYIPDANQDDIPDGPPQVMIDGFTVAKDNYHNLANGLRWGPDGWLYGRCGHSCPGKLGIPGTPDDLRIPMKGGIWRFHPERKIVEVLTHGTTNPWGHDWDQNGEMFFINTVTGHLWHLIPGAHLTDSSTMNPFVYEKLDTIADHYHYDRSGSWQASRDGKANSLGGGHAHIGMMIYQGTQWPEQYRNKLFTLNMHGRRANVERLERHGGGYVGKHEPDVFLSDDPWFRGTEISTGPDGSGFILDWSDTGECHDSTGVHRKSGRIFRISYGELKKPVLAGISEELQIGLERQMDSKNDWHVRRARNLIYDSKRQPKTDAILREMADSELRAIKTKQPTERLLPRLWLLNSLNEVGVLQKGEWNRTLLRNLGHEDENVRVWALRFITQFWPIDLITGESHPSAITDTGDIADLLRELALSERSSLVRLTLASTLQRLPLKNRPELASQLLSKTEDANDPFLPYIVWYGISPLAKHEPAALVKLAQRCQWPKTLKWITRSLATQPEHLNALLFTFGAPPSVGKVSPGPAAPKRPPEDSTPKCQAILEGMAEAFKGLRKVPKPEAWDAFVVRALARSGSVEERSRMRDRATNSIRDLAILFGDGRALDDLKKIALDNKAELSARETSLKTLIEARPDDLRVICEQLLDTRNLNMTAARGLALFDDPEIGKQLAKNYRKFYPLERPAVMETLISRPSFAKALLENIGEGLGKIARSDISAFQARQIRGFKDENLTQKLTEVWGELRDSAADKKELIEKVKKQLDAPSLAKANLSQGRVLFTAVCGACHQMYGQGGKLGPDLTGSGRANIDYLLENIADPSGVVSADYRMSLITLKDGRSLSGVIASTSEQTLTLRTLVETMTLNREDITKIETSTVSMMPEGLLLALQPDQIRDLIAYLMHPVQVK